MFNRLVNYEFSEKILCWQTNPVHIFKVKILSRGCQSKILIVEPIELNWNQSNWLVESIELNRIIQSDNWSERSDNRIQLNIYMFFSVDWFRLTLIDFDWFNWSVWSSSIDLIGQFDWFDRSVCLNSTGFTLWLSSHF